MSMKLATNKMGFTTIEFFITLGMLAIIAGVVFFIFNPLQRYREVRDVERQNAVAYLGDALAQCIFDNNGTIPDFILKMDDAASYIIGSSQEGCAKICKTSETKDACLDMSEIRCGMGRKFKPEYISSLPIDPNTSKWNREKTGYYIAKTSKNDITIGACDPEEGIIKILKEF